MKIVSVLFFAFLFNHAGLAQCSNNLFVNGSFTGPEGENVAAPYWTIAAQTPDVNDAVGPLNTTAGYIWNGVPLASANGGSWQNLSLAEKVSQTLSVVSGRCYTLCFEYAAQPIHSPPGFNLSGAIGITVRINNVLVYTTPSDYTPFTWEQACYSFVADTSSIKITFGATSQNYVAIDGACLEETSFIGLGNDLLMCPSTGLQLNAYSYGVLSYLWQDSSTYSVFNVDTPGIYYVQATTGCGTIGDTVVVSLIDSAVSVGNDTTICFGATVVLNATTPGATGYLWQNGTNSPTCIASQPGKYYVKVFTSCDTLTDTMLIEQYDFVVNLGNDTILCPGSTLLLSATNSAGAYLWQDGSVDSSFLVTEAGFYSVHATTLCGVYSDSIMVNTYTPSVYLGKDTILCMGTSINLAPVDSVAGLYMWQDGSNGTYYQATSAGTYHVRVTTTCGLVSDTIVVTYENCNCKLVLPNAFSPNSNNKNDAFTPPASARVSRVPIIQISSTTAHAIAVR